MDIRIGTDYAVRVGVTFGTYASGSWATRATVLAREGKRWLVEEHSRVGGVTQVLRNSRDIHETWEAHEARKARRRAEQDKAAEARRVATRRKVAIEERWREAALPGDWRWDLGVRLTLDDCEQVLRLLAATREGALNDCIDLCMDAQAQHFDGEITEAHAEAARLEGRIRALLPGGETP